MSERILRTWRSRFLDRDMTVARWGWFGTPVLLFPTAAADCLDYERFLLIRVLRPLIEAGRVKVYSCESVTGDAWMNGDASPQHKAWLQARFGDYLGQELLPWIREDCEGFTGYIAAGASLGAYNAVNAACRNPGWFTGCVAMSGTYYFDRWHGGPVNPDYYHHQPMYYLGNLGPGPMLEGIRRVRFVLATGRGRAEAPQESIDMAELLRSKGAHVDLEIWGQDVHHDWPTWRTMLPLFLDRMT